MNTDLTDLDKFGEKIRIYDLEIKEEVKLEPRMFIV